MSHDHDHNNHDEHHEHHEDDNHSHEESHEHDGFEYEHKSDTHWHWEHWHDDHWHDEHWEEDHWHDDEHSEEEEKKPPIMNDILKEKKDVKMDDLFLLTKLTLYRNLFKENTLDLKTELKDIDLYNPLKLKLFKLKTHLNDIEKKRNITCVFLSDYKPKIDKLTLNILNIDDFKNELETPVFDMTKIKSSFKFDLKKLFQKQEGKKENVSKNNDFSFIYSYLRYLLFSLMFFAIVIWYWFFVKNKLENTLVKVQNIKISKDISILKSEVKNLKNDFLVLNILLKPIFWWNNIFENNNITNLEFIISWAIKLWNFSTNWIEIYDWIDKILKEKWPSWIMYSQLIKNLDPTILKMIQDLNSAVLSFENVKSLWDVKRDLIFLDKKEKLKTINNYLDIFYKNKNIIENILWDQRKRTYLVIFQNSDEIRPTWWFMWSVWIIDIFKWKLINLEKKDIYALEWDLKPFTEKAPEWINKISPTLWLRDANYYLSTRDNSIKIKSFLDRTNYKIDWIIYINQNIIVDSLKTFWWFHFSKINSNITWENFSMVMSSLVESKITKTHTLATPKQILFDFIIEYFSNFKEKWDYLWYFKFIINSIEKKDIIIYSFQEEENNFFESLNIYKEADYSKYLDFNYPIFTSISWNKSDRYVKREFEKNITLNDDCSINTTLKIKQNHTFNQDTESEIKKFMYDNNLLEKIDYNSSIYIQWKWSNKQFVRILVPKMSIIETAKNTKINEYKNFKEISFYTEVKPWENKDFSIKYKLENKDCKKYDFYLEKQPWLKEFRFLFYKNDLLKIEKYSDKDIFVWEDSLK